jgi:hypothetical protein
MSHRFTAATKEYLGFSRSTVQLQAVVLAKETLSTVVLVHSSLLTLANAEWRDYTATQEILYEMQIGPPSFSVALVPSPVASIVPFRRILVGLVHHLHLAITSTRDPGSQLSRASRLLAVAATHTHASLLFRRVQAFYPIYPMPFWYASILYM